MPEDRLHQVAGAAIVQELGVAIHRLGEADTPERRRAPFLTIGQELRATVCKPRPHVMQQHVGIRPDGLVGQLRFGGVGPGGEHRHMATLAVGLEEQALARQHLCIIHIPAGGNGQIAGIESDVVENRVAHFYLAAIGHGQAIGLGRGTGIRRHQMTAQPHVIGEGFRILLAQTGLAGFPAEAPHGGGVVAAIPDPVGPTADTITVLVLRIGMGQQVRFRNRFQQPQSNHWWSNTRGKQGRRVHLSIGQVAEAQARLAQLHLMAILKGDRAGAVLHPYPPFRFNTRDGRILKLPAVDRLRHQSALGQVIVGRRRHGQPHQHGDRLLGVRPGRVPATILDMTVLAGIGIEQRPQPITGIGGCWRNHPGVAEKAVAHTEVQPPRRRQIGQRQREGVLVGLGHRGVACR